MEGRVRPGERQPAYIAKTGAAAAQQQAKANARDRAQKHQKLQMCRLHGECRAFDRHYVGRPVSQQTWDAWNNRQQDAYASAFGRRALLGLVDQNLNAIGPTAVFYVANLYAMLQQEGAGQHPVPLRISDFVSPQQLEEARTYSEAHPEDSDAIWKIIGVTAVAAGLGTDSNGGGYGGRVVDWIGSSSDDVAREALGLSSPSSRELAANLEGAGLLRSPETAAHHIVAGSADAAAPARDVLARFGIDINSAENGVFLPANRSASNPSGAAVHSTLHSGAYYETVNALLLSATTRAEAIDALGYLREALLRGDL